MFFSCVFYDVLDKSMLLPARSQLRLPVGFQPASRTRITPLEVLSSQSLIYCFLPLPCIVVEFLVLVDDLAVEENLFYSLLLLDCHESIHTQPASNVMDNSISILIHNCSI